MSKMEFSDEFDFENRITDTSEIPEDTAESDNPLRPKTLSEYIGQEKAKENLKVFIEAAKSEAKPLTMYCSTALRDSVKQLFRELLRMNSVCQ